MGKNGAASCHLHLPLNIPATTITANDTSKHICLTVLDTREILLSLQDEIANIVVYRKEELKNSPATTAERKGRG